MNDLLLYLIALYSNDLAIKKIFADAGASAVVCLSPDQRTQAAYPRFILYGNEGKSSQYGDVLPKFSDGVVYVECVAKQSDVNARPLKTIKDIEDRVKTLTLGNPALHIQGLQGSVVSAAYRVDLVQQLYSRLLPKEDVTIQRWGASFRVKLNNTAL